MVADLHSHSPFSTIFVLLFSGGFFGLSGLEGFEVEWPIHLVQKDVLKVKYLCKRWELECVNTVHLHELPVPIHTKMRTDGRTQQISSGGSL